MTDAIDQRSFRRIIQRNIALPLVMGLVNIAVFIGLVVYLVSTMSWVEHSERVIGDANEMMRLAVERQSSSRGFSSRATSASCPSTRSASASSSPSSIP